MTRRPSLLSMCLTLALLAACGQHNAVFDEPADFDRASFDTLRPTVEPQRPTATATQDAVTSPEPTATDDTAASSATSVVAATPTATPTPAIADPAPTSTQTTATSEGNSTTPDPVSAETELRLSLGCDDRVTALLGELDGTAVRPESIAIPSISWACPRTPAVFDALACRVEATTALIEAMEARLGETGASAAEEMRRQDFVFCDHPTDVNQSLAFRDIERLAIEAAAED